MVAEQVLPGVLQSVPFSSVSLILGPVTHPIVYGAWEKGAHYRRLSGGGLFPCASSGSRRGGDKLAWEAPPVVDTRSAQGRFLREPTSTQWFGTRPSVS